MAASQIGGGATSGLYLARALLDGAPETGMLIALLWGLGHLEVGSLGIHLVDVLVGFYEICRSLGAPLSAFSVERTTWWSTSRGISMGLES